MRVIPREVQAKRYAIGLTEFNKLRLSLKISLEQKAVIVGSILGDGYLQNPEGSNNARLQVRNTLKYHDYVKWKFKFFKHWCPNGIKYDIANNSVYFLTIYHPELHAWHRKFYVGIKKVIPSDIGSILTSPVSLAIWLMDDGNGYLRAKSLRISTYCFTFEENELLQKCLKQNFDIESKIYVDSKGCQLYIPAKSAIKTYSLIQAYIHPLMEYKFARLNPVETTRKLLSMGKG